MPRLIDYAAVEQRTAETGLVCLYHNSGAFGFPASADARSVGWVGPDDPSIRPAARALTRPVPPPYEINLAAACVRAWTGHLPGPVWVTPKSHWAYELDFGSRAWLPGALATAGVSPADVDALAGRHDGSAVEFAADESSRFAPLLLSLLQNLFGSDFLLTWLDRPVVCTVHHHKQLWWTTTDPNLLSALQSPSAAGPP